MKETTNKKTVPSKNAASGDTSELNSTFEERIGSLTEENEDLKYDLQDAKEDLKKKSDECKKLLSDKKGLEIKIKSLDDKLNAQTKELKEEKSQNEERKELIDFVNAILNAKEASDEYTKTRNDAIENVRNVLCQYYESLVYFNLVGGRELIPSLAYQWSNEHKKPWLKGKKVVALIGEFSAGKTSIVNRILSQDNPNAPQLPTNSKATTAIPTYISYGPEFISQFLDANGKLKNIKKEDFERVKKDFLHNVSVSSLLNHFVMSYDNRNLEGLTILDTPGFSSNDPEDESRTCEVIKEADMLFWVFDANQSLNKSSINIIKSNVRTVPLFIIMNKCDQLSPNEQNQQETHLKKVLSQEGIKIQDVIRFSEKYAIDILMRAINSVESKKEGDVVTLVLEDLYSLYDEINKRYRQCQEALKKHKRKLVDADKKIQHYLDLYEKDLNVVESMPQYERCIFEENYYRISMDDYDELSERCQTMLGYRKPLETQVNNLKDLTKTMTDIESDYAELKQKRKMLIEYEKKIIDAVRDFNPNAYIPVHA